jgi:tetratricopeptide (TPR) repeat protein
MSAYRSKTMRWLVVLLLGLWTGPVYGGQAEVSPEPESVFHEANRHYEQGDYASAIAAYERLLEGGRSSAALHFNLGNAWFKSGRTGQAIWHYRVARELSPRDADVRANLRFARNQVGAPVSEGRLQRWVGLLSLNEWTVVSVGLFWIWVAGMIAGQVSVRSWPSLRFWTWLLLVAWVGSALTLALAWHEQSGKPTAVVVADGEVHYGPFAESQTNYAVADGLELKVLDRREGWVQVEDARRGIGWIDQSRVALLDR